MNTQHVVNNNYYSLLSWFLKYHYKIENCLGNNNFTMIKLVMLLKQVLHAACIIIV